jgi:hypothetical protein
LPLEKREQKDDIVYGQENKKPGETLFFVYKLKKRERTGRCGQNGDLFQWGSKKPRWLLEAKLVEVSSHSWKEDS